MIGGLGFDILDPWKLTSPDMVDRVVAMPYGEDKRAAWRTLNPVIGRNNRDAIKSCDLVVAVLDGTDVDSGTAAEIGYAAGIGKAIEGYRGDFRLASDNDGSTVNLQVEFFITGMPAYRGSIARDLLQLKAALGNFLSLYNMQKSYQLIPD